MNALDYTPWQPIVCFFHNNRTRLSTTGVGIYESIMEREMMMARRRRTDIFEKRVHRFIWDIVETEKAPSLRHIQSECVGFWAIETQWVGLRRMTSQKSSYDLDQVRQKLGVLLRRAVTVGLLAVVECSDGRQGDIAKTEVLKLYV